MKLTATHHTQDLTCRIPLAARETGSPAGMAVSPSARTLFPPSGGGRVTALATSNIAGVVAPLLEMTVETAQTSGSEAR